MSRRRGSGRYWVGLALGAVILSIGLLGDYCITPPSGTGTYCTFGSMDVGWGIAFAGSLIVVASLVGIARSRRKARGQNAPTFDS